MRRYDVPDLDAYFERWSHLHLGYDPRAAFWPRTWLTLTYRAARPLARRGASPNLISCAGALVSAAVPAFAWLGGGWLLLSGVLVVASGLIDNLDGAVAALTDRATAAGYVLDSMADRLSDGCYLIALWLVGAPAWLCVAAGVVTMLQEYLRARAANAGVGELNVVTVAERPTRVIATAFAMCAAAVAPTMSAGPAAASAGTAAAIGVWVWLGLSVVAFVQLALAVRRSVGSN